jgi:hypothetical protein
MKKQLLFILFVFISTFGNAQDIFAILQPSDLAGSYDFTKLDSQWWPNAPDMLDPTNAVSAELAMALDNTAADSLVGSPVVSDVTGKIAVIYRGGYSFAGKVWRAQEAGAVAVIMINNLLDPVLITMSANTADDTSSWVTIPAVFISQLDGAQLRDEIIAGGLMGFIGNKNGFYGNDLGITADYVIRAPQSSMIQGLALDENEFSASIGTWVRNYGSNDQTGIIVNGMVDSDGNNLYNEDAVAFDLASGDSAFVPLPNFSQSSYELATYNIAYSVSSDSTEDFNDDNAYDVDFAFDENLYSFVSVTDGEPILNYFVRPGSIAGLVQQCVHFQDANASRIGVTGMTFAASSDYASMDGLEVNTVAYEWAIEFDDLLDTINYTGIDPDDFDELATGTYDYVGNDMSGENVFVPFDENILLEDNLRYLFCITYTEDDSLFMGHDNKIDYLTTLNEYLQPMFPMTDGELNSDNEEIWYLSGFGTDIVPSYVVHTVDANAIGIEEIGDVVDVTPFPNPAKDFIQIPMNDVSGITTIHIFDLSGKLVESQTLNATAGNLLRVDVSSLDAGIYTFGLRYENGKVSNFNVVITR